MKPVHGSMCGTSDAFSTSARQPASSTTPVTNAMIRYRVRALLAAARRSAGTGGWAKVSSAMLGPFQRAQVGVVAGQFRVVAGVDGCGHHVATVGDRSVRLGRRLRPCERFAMPAVAHHAYPDHDGRDAERPPLQRVAEVLQAEA